MKKITLEEMLQKHFRLNSALELTNKINTYAEWRSWSVQGQKAYARMVSFLTDLSTHVASVQNDTNLANKISDLIKIFYTYEYEN